MEENDILRMIANLESRDARIAQVFINITKYDVLPRVVWDFNGIFIYVNQLFADIIGYDAQELIGKKFKDLVVAEDWEDTLRVYSANFEAGGVTILTNFENRYYRKDGSIVKIRWIKGFNDTDNRIGSGQCQQV